MTNRKYFNESHRKYSEACQKEVAEMSKTALSEAEFRAQIERNRVESLRLANPAAASQTMYASGLICSLVCDTCDERPCPHQSWIAKNSCPKIIAYNEKLGQCCATCIHCVAEQYCTKKAGGKAIKPSTDFTKFKIEGDIIQHTCEEWTNKIEE